MRIEPNLGRFEPSGETRIPIDILRQLRLVAKNKAGEIEKHLESLPHNVQWAAQTLRPEPPHIEAFAVEKADECTTKVKVIWRVSNVEKVEIRPIGEVKPSGEALIDIVLLSGLTIMARSPVEVIEKKYKPEPPSWFQENKYVQTGDRKRSILRMCISIVANHQTIFICRSEKN
ncbi:MAG: hypothetical protein RML35_11945 [Chloroherpetonaceae bacterium]|nr:hypothetical protein [Chloroherpetonaceae bacterium]